MTNLQKRLDTQSHSAEATRSTTRSIEQASPTGLAASTSPYDPIATAQPLRLDAYRGGAGNHVSGYMESAQNHQTSTHGSPVISQAPRKSRRSHFIVEAGRLPDFVSIGLLTMEQAEKYFTTFFEGCDHYVPVFDPAYDTMPSIRQRSSFLFATICTVGCRVVCGTDSHEWRLLNFHLKRMISSVLSTPVPASLETVQALMVRACYSAERSLFVASATRLAIEIGLPDSYDEMSAAMVNDGGRHLTGADALMRQTRTWFHLLVLSFILHVDAGDMMTFKFVGDPRRTRIILDSPHATVLDRFLFAQVELNVLRANIFASLSDPAYEDEEEILSLVRDAKIDIELWHSDWERMLEQMRDVPAWIRVNLRVQKCWANTMALCRAVKAAGVENVDFMSPAQRSILAMAKEALRQHLQTIIAEPRLYLHYLRYAMDFVWAKCAFCYLLLLKLCILLPEDSASVSDDLVRCGLILAQELGAAGGAAMSGISNTTAKMYLQLLRTGMDKFTRALRGEYGQLDATGSGNEGPAADAEFHGSSAKGDLDSFVPDQFVFEWDFPGLTLFSSSTTGIGWLDDILLGALNGGGDFFGFMAPTGDNSE